ncbi:Putative CONSERVED LIPOPROTEIN LPQP [Minicystis rosea]|nr:Putative CONSERVED LIPOPROTEIN LPQP [Minicystis rosea]
MQHTWVSMISLTALLGGCSSSPVETSTGTGGAGGAGTTSASSSSATGTGGGTVDPDAGPPTVQVLTDLSVAGYPHKIDVFVPSNAERVVVFLHGGGGSKVGAASTESGIRLDNPAQATPVPNTTWLTARRTAYVFPQGQAVSTSPKATTWDNYVMTSGADDVAFLAALAGALRAGTFDGAVPAFARVYLAGHSNGGMMANRMWCESPATFDAYGALAGPASVRLAPAGLVSSSPDPLLGEHACAPATPKPYIGILGAQDTILQTKNAWSADTWSINDCLSQGGGGGMVDPNLVNEQRFHGFRVAAMCSGTASPPTTSPDGATTTWSDCGDKIRLVGITNADHCVSAGKVVCLNDKLLPGDCDNSLEAESGAAMRDLLVDFFAATE